MENRVGSCSGIRRGDASIRAVEESEAAGVCLSRVGVPGAAASGMARSWCEARARQPRRTLVSGLAHRRAGRLRAAHRHRRLFVRPHVSLVPGSKPLRAMARLAESRGRVAAPDARCRHRRPPGLPLVRPVELAGRDVPAPHLQRRAAGKLRALPRPALRPCFRGPAPLHRLALPQRLFCALRTGTRIHHAPDAADRRQGRAARKDRPRFPHGDGRATRSAVPRARLGLPRLAILLAVVHWNRGMEQRAEHDPGARPRGVPQLRARPIKPSSANGSSGPRTIASIFVTRGPSWVNPLSGKWTGHPPS